MLLGDILFAKGLVSKEDISRALEHQKEHGGRFGECLVDLELVTAEQIEEVLTEAPAAPRDIEDTGVDPNILLQLLAKGIYAENLETPSQLANALKLPSILITKLLHEATERKLLESLGQTQPGSGAVREVRYGLSRLGRSFALEAMEQSQYVGPAPVALEDYSDRVMRQRVSNEWVSRPMMDEAFKGLILPDRFLARLGPALNSGTAMLLYGPAGNGKTTIGEIVGKIFENVVYIPHCFEVDGAIVKVFDPSVHRTIEGETEGKARGLRKEPLDRRWVPCFRPMVITGGELTLEMLDLKFNEIAKFYEAPLHIKALNGTFLIDDFGRQLVKPEDLLNRWIVPLNSRVDYLALHTGKSFQIPFDELVIFSTNLHPNDLMDPAFQRRISYKLETVEPPEDLFRDVFRGMADERGLELSDDILEMVIAKIRELEAPLAYFQPKFIVEQVLASCKFEGKEPQFTPQNVEDAMLNLFVSEPESEMFGVRRS